MQVDALTFFTPPPKKIIQQKSLIINLLISGEFKNRPDIKSTKIYLKSGDVTSLHSALCVTLSPVRLHLGPPPQRAPGGLWLYG